MLSAIEAFVWAGKRKYILGVAIAVVILMLVFGENVEWIAE